VELVLVLALFILFIAVLIPAAGALFRGAQHEAPEETALEVLQDARRLAVLNGHEVRLVFEPETHRFVWTDGTQEEHRAVADAGLAVDFLRPREGAAILLGGQLVETNPVRQLEFYADGTCDPVRLQLRGTDTAPRVVPIDPWTCAPVLEGRK
jgi:hypothetical protein